ncbi:MAG: EAL domain-containing protein [Rhodocyclaceae bacterium]|jgi:EAL domain-containing protein (putative c-di-GMP-specific phosphodiesterase class I)|nr:EAL domain-containing protein [Rhodocyclaceae bacterium]MCL4756981.1 EAL domain-containing protein [Rhodocyclaceae bacterium]
MRVERLWFLESVAADGSRVAHPIGQMPFRIGRDPDNDLVLATRGLSRHHAMLTPDISGRLRLTDLNSTNGSFVNRTQLVGSCLLADNDILHFGTAEFRLRRHQSEQFRFQPDDSLRTVLMPSDMTLSELFVPNEAEFLDLLDGHGLTGAAQPIVHAHDRSIFAYELLGRANHPLLPEMPMRLFELAGALDREVDLSAAFRKYGICSIAPRLHGYPLFVNTHPKETFDQEFFRSLAVVRKQMPDLDLIVEIHETAITETSRLAELTTALHEIGVRFAFDDFGAGQARLSELGDSPPDFVKFDIGLVHGIHLANDRKQHLLADLVKMVLEVGSVPLAEGVEQEPEAELCRTMGFKLIQGFLTGRPIPADEL